MQIRYGTTNIWSMGFTDLGLTQVNANTQAHACEARVRVCGKCVVTTSKPSLETYTIVMRVNINK